MRHQADLVAEALVADAGQRQAADLDRSLVGHVVAQQQRQQGRLAAAGVADDAEEGALRHVERQVVQHRLARDVGEFDVAHPHRRGAGDERRFVLRALGIVLRRARLVEQRVHARRRHHRLLQAAELHGDLDEGLHHARDIADEGVQHAHLDRADLALAEGEDHQRQQGDVEQVERGPQQEGVGAQFGHARRVVAAVGAQEALAETHFGIAGLQHAHAADRLGHLGVDVAAQGTRAGDRRRRQALVEPDDADHRRHQGQHDQHQAPVEPGHRDHGADQDDRVVEHDVQDLDVQGLDRLGVVGHAADQLAGDGAVEEGHRQAQHVAIDPFAQALHRAHRQARQADQLQVAHPARDPAGEHQAAQQQGHLGPVEVARQQVVVDQGLAQQRAQDFEGRGQDQPQRGDDQVAFFGRGGAAQQARGQLRLVAQLAAFHGRCVRLHRGWPPVVGSATGWHTSHPARAVDRGCRLRPRGRP